jgi:hypothetical protein
VACLLVTAAVLDGIFDDELVATMVFDENGVSGAEISDGPANRTRRWRDLVWHLDHDRPPRANGDRAPACDLP